MQDESLAEHGFCLLPRTGPAGDAAQHAQRGGCGELVAEQSLLCKAFGCSLSAALVVARDPVGRRQPGQGVACAEAVTEILVLPQRPEKVPVSCLRVACYAEREP